ncbi:galanin receptor type 1-like isoform X1 [Montipora foliosa]|uniref:galanin receptor type 1-like isoform X1 n=2 Tax=Montipora foliosa TaxID=591990 RepID=UPI0035F219E7
MANYLTDVQPWNYQSEAFVITMALYGLIFVIGIIGNGIVVAFITALRRRGQKSSVQLFLLHLAISDLMVCLLCVPLTIYINFHYPREYRSTDHGLCKLSRFMQNLGPVLSISLLTAISIDRYMTFVKQEFSRSQRSWYFKPSWLTLFAWVYGTSQNLPVFHTADVAPIKFNNSTTVYYCSTTQGSTLQGKIVLFASFLFGFLIPLVAMVISYVCVVRVVWTRDRRFSSSRTPRDIAIANAKILERSRKRVLRVLLSVVFCFFACWLPFAVYHGILERYLKEPPNPMDAIRLTTYGFGLANSMCNPFVYYFSVGGKTFKAAKRRFVELMGGRTIRQWLSVQGSTYTSRTTGDYEVPSKIIELGFDQSSDDYLKNNLSDNCCVEFAFNESCKPSHEFIDTRL